MIINIHYRKKKNLLYSTIILVIVFLFTLLFGSCSADDDRGGDYEDLYSISLSPNINEGNKSRVTGADFDRDDKIGVYVVQYSNNNTTPGAIGHYQNYAANVAHIFNGYGWYPESGKRLPWMDQSTKVDIYAYYPFIPELDAMDEDVIKEYPIEVQPDQSVRVGYEASDFLWAKSQPTLPTGSSIDLPFTHRLSKIKINLKSDSGFRPEELTNAILNIYNAVQSGTVDFSTGTATPDKTAGGVMKPLLQSVPDAGFDATFGLIVYPQTIKSGTNLITVRMYEEQAPYVYTTTGDLLFESQKERSFNITINRSGISVAVGGIQDWESAPAQDGNIGQQAPWVADLDKVDWSKSLVHNVTYKGAKVAEITREYLYKSGTIDRQAIVVYPVDSNGKTDLTKGFVAQVMGATINEATELYPPDTGSNIHGGTASWGSNVLSAYTNGGKAIVRKVKIDNGTVSAASEVDVDFLTIEPDIITDKRGAEQNIYSIVKIGTQYWMAENLRAEKYRTGEAIEHYYYNNDSNFKTLFGALYTWYAASNIKGLNPEGWHIPSNAEFKSLETYLGTTPGKKLKSIQYWNNKNNSSNITGFRGYPAGRKLPGGTFNEIYNYGQWWTATQSSSTAQARIYLDYGNTSMWFTSLTFDYTQSVRCLRD